MPLLERKYFPLQVSNTVNADTGPMHDLDIINDLRNGRDMAFRSLLERYQALVLNCTFRFVRNRESAEDLTQEVFLEVYESLPSFRGDSQLSTWIYRIAVTKSLNHLKARKRKKRFAFVVSLFGDDQVEEQAAAPDGADPASVLENIERAEILNRALGRLPENQRIAFTLSKVEGMSYNEIALIMDVSIPSVESLIHRARVRLRQTLTFYYEQHLS
jgi:RNA polymerase sigma factor (sigma-70 family)